IDIAKGTIVHSPHLPTASHMPVVAMLTERLGAPGVVGNDANLAALAEHRYGAGQDTDDLLFITVSTGIGGGIISRGELLLGAHGYAGEIGHMTIDASGPSAKSTTPGAWEALCSGTALARIATERINAGEGSSLAAALADTGAEAMTARDVFAAYHDGDALARSVIADGVRHMAVALTSLVNILDPGKIIIGGGLSNQWDDYIAPAVALMREQSFAGMARDTPVVLPALGADAGAYGAIALALGAAGEGAV
ncbi:MAG: ROK family protein, partial [Chloroflexi bacterium]|nr:ROK family protein [Chloroflexota bacterium]